jgi:hypothetical protein
MNYEMPMSLWVRGTESFGLNMKCPSQACVLNVWFPAVLGGAILEGGAWLRKYPKGLS